MGQEKTLGERRVRTAFNPAGSEKDIVDAIKQRSAQLIDLVDELGVAVQDDGKGNVETVGEFRRLKSLAMTAYEEAAMWAVKAATF